MTLKQHINSQICPACGSQNVSELFSIRDIPIHCNVPQGSKAEALNVDKGEIHLGVCRNCGHLYNLAFNPQLIQYAPGYENALDYSPLFREYVNHLAQRLIDNYDLHGKQIIEIACGRGNFLKLMCKLGNNRGIGFDPSHIGEVGHSDIKVEFIRDFYSEQYSHHKADFICCRHALEHINFPQVFLKTVRHAIGNRANTTVFFEVPNSLYTLKELGIWDLIYEHCSYFCSTSLARVFGESGFNVSEVREEYGGQFLSRDVYRRIRTDDSAAQVS